MRSSENQYVTFYIDQELYGVNIFLVKEVNPDTKITKIPSTEDYIRGLINIRGQIILVLDMMMIFKRIKQNISYDSQILIFKTTEELLSLEGVESFTNAKLFGDKSIGLLVDKIGDVVMIDDHELEKVKSIDHKNISHFLGGVYNYKGQPLYIVNTEEILSF